MSHPGNWSPQKIASVRRANAREAWAKIAHAEYRDVVAPGQHFQGFTAQTPCETSRGDMHGYAVTAHCWGCLHFWQVEWEKVLHTKWSHTPWKAVVRKMRCTVCDHPVERLEFRSLSLLVGSIVAKLPMTPDEVAQIPPEPGLKVIEGFKPEPMKATADYWKKRRG